MKITHEIPASEIKINLEVTEFDLIFNETGVRAYVGFNHEPDECAKADFSWDEIFHQALECHPTHLGTRGKIAAKFREVADRLENEDNQPTS